MRSFTISNVGSEPVTVTVPGSPFPSSFGWTGVPATALAFTVTPTHLGFDEYDIAAQGLVSHHYWVDDGQLEVFSAPFRYVWPSELDLMARLAGMTLRERWSGWKHEPFTSESTTHVSVWEKSI